MQVSRVTLCDGSVASPRVGRSARHRASGTLTFTVIWNDALPSLDAPAQGGCFSAGDGRVEEQLGVTPIALDLLGVGDLQVALLGLDRDEVIDERPPVERGDR